LNHDWPGNIRELANVLERAQILAEEHLITLEDLPDMIRPASSNRGAASSAFDLGELERRTVQAALQQLKGNKAQVARALGVSRRALYRMIEKYGLEEAAAEDRTPEKGERR
jgi:transcriptional regulator of acetoin/glycerol metabolism